MSCSAMEALIPDWLAGALDPETARAVAAHVASCARCRSVQASWQALDEALSAEFAAAPPVTLPGLTERIQAAVQLDARAEAAQAKRWRQVRLVLILTGLLTGLLFLLTVPLGRLAPWLGGRSPRELLFGGVWASVAVLAGCALLGGKVWPGSQNH